MSYMLHRVEICKKKHILKLDFGSRKYLIQHVKKLMIR